MAWQVFYSYSHRDTELRDRLATHLAPLRHKGRIVEWHDRKIAPGADWNSEISHRLDSAHLVLLLLSPDFLASDYCFGVEVERCLTRLKSGSLKVVPVLLRPCLWEDSLFSELQIIPRDARPLSSAASEESWKEVALEISKLVAGSPPSTNPAPSVEVITQLTATSPTLDLVRGQVRAYAKLYERTRQRMAPGAERTRRMEGIFRSMRALALGYHPMLPELANSPSPGERLAAVALLQVVASQDYLTFLVKTVGSDSPFVGYHAVRALRFAVSALDPASYAVLVEAFATARVALQSVSAGTDSDRWRVLAEAGEELRARMALLAASESER